MNDVRVLAGALSSRPTGVRAYGALSPAARGLELPLPAAAAAASPAAAAASARAGGASACALASPFASARRPRGAAAEGADPLASIVGLGLRGAADRSPGTASAGAAGWLAPSLGGLEARGYSTDPPLSALRAMSEAELAAVGGFAVVRAGHGSVAWPGDTDVRGLRLDGALAIEGGPACPRGRGRAAAEPGVEVVAARAPALDKRARVTLFGVEPPPEAAAGGEAAAQAFEAALRLRCEAHGATFVSYCPAEGWRLRFDVSGFS